MGEKHDTSMKRSSTKSLATDTSEPIEPTLSFRRLLGSSLVAGPPRGADDMTKLSKSFLVSKPGSADCETAT